MGLGKTDQDTFWQDRDHRHHIGRHRNKKIAIKKELRGSPFGRKRQCVIKTENLKRNEEQTEENKSLLLISHAVPRFVCSQELPRRDSGATNRVLPGKQHSFHSRTHLHKLKNQKR